MFTTKAVPLRAIEPLTQDLQDALTTDGFSWNTARGAGKSTWKTPLQKHRHSVLAQGLSKQNH